MTLYQAGAVGVNVVSTKVFTFPRLHVLITVTGVTAGSEILWSENPVALAELSVHVNRAEVGRDTATSSDGALGGTATTRARIISFSSWPSR
jgi:hypothetical protein